MHATSDDDLQIFRLRVRGHLLERMLSALYGAIPADREAIRPIQLAMSSSLEWHARFSERDLMSAPELEILSASERSLFADEFREVVSELKAFVENLTNDNREEK